MDPIVFFMGEGIDDVTLVIVLYFFGSRLEDE